MGVGTALSGPLLLLAEVISIAPCLWAGLLSAPWVYCWPCVNETPVAAFVTDELAPTGTLTRAACSALATAVMLTCQGAHSLTPVFSDSKVQELKVHSLDLINEGKTGFLLCCHKLLRSLHHTK